MQNHKRGLKVATHAMIVGLALSTATIGAPAAFAQTTSITQSTANFTIHKYKNVNTLGVPTGERDTKLEGSNAASLEGVTFTIQRLDYDITTKAGFDAAAQKATELKASKDASTITNLEGSVFSQTTPSSGVVQFENVPVGAYLVQEKSTPKGVVPIDPFIVFLPMTKSDGTGWNYDVHSYPKNAVNTVKKEIKGLPQANTGDVLPYMITTQKPAQDMGSQYISYFAIKDALPDILEATAANLQAVTVTAAGVTEDFVNGTDFTATVADTSPTVTGKSRTVTVAFTKSGLVKLMSGTGSGDVTVTLPVTVQEITSANGGVAGNTAEVVFKVKDNSENDSSNPDDPRKPGSPDTPAVPVNPSGATSPEHRSEWFNVKVKKKSDDAASTALAGAVFELYHCEQNGNLTGNALTVGPEQDRKNTFTTGDGENGSTLGELNIGALMVPKQTTGKTDYFYCIKEIKAPAGHELLVDPVVIDPTNVTAGETKTVDVTNVQKTSSNLPATGGAGVGLLMALGASILGLGAFAAKRSSRKS
ncbi:SpaH/EbpB family LPXTG-anchored major pilin [Corynebacterium sp. P5848]|uniref:SpaH/EbpB family LPXTG-anchored major pilin n=1 Tax=Corynebacterium marambiense TaxID=2765364 RepID=UPI0022608216|nr:SpaH/EbpB family LPXTG-anchored major pilin [Corynebacterium marambiense]MCX7541773.1 SpaH/EbpB family LPXTG-anchored major pilin [Corynebacterium marambiense]